MLGVETRTNGMLVRYAGIPFTGCDLERCTNMDGTWEKIAEVEIPAGGEGEYLDAVAPAPAGYYRYRLR
jgi:hypothetical protein